MNTKTILAASLVAVFAVSMIYGGTTLQALANPSDSNGVPIPGKKVYQWMLIGRPNDFTGDCGEGNRIFVNANDPHAHMVVTDGDSWNVLDCNGTGGNRAVLQSSQSGNFQVWASAKGKPGTGLSNICLQTVATHDALGGDRTDCLIATFDIKREGGKTSFQLLPKALFDASLEDIIWSFDVDGQAKIQFRVMQVLA